MNGDRLAGLAVVAMSVLLAAVIVGAVFFGLHP